MTLYPKRGTDILPRICNPRRTALIICDMWDQHWCASATERTVQMAPRINTLAGVMRDAGSLIIHAPSDTMDFYTAHPARRRLREIGTPPAVKPVGEWERKTFPPMAIDYSDGGCDCPAVCEQKKAWNRQIPVIGIHDSDIIGDGISILSYMKQCSITDVVFAGVHANMCVLWRPFGLISLMFNGFYPMLIRDLTDAMYNHRMPPYVSHFRGNEICIRYIEAHVAPTITSDQIIGGVPFVFAGNMLSEENKEY